MKETEFIHFRSVCGRYGVSFRHALLDMMLRECKKAGHNETGGIIWGKYNSNWDDAVITGFSPPPSDSHMGRFSFNRGIAGLQTKIQALWKKKNREYYLGEWHFHPFASSAASSTDRQQMFAHANKPELQCPEPIMIIIGGNPRHDWDVNMAVYTRAGDVYVLMPQNSNWQADCFANRATESSTASSPETSLPNSKWHGNPTWADTPLAIDVEKGFPP